MASTSASAMPSTHTSSHASDAPMRYSGAQPVACASHPGGEEAPPSLPSPPAVPGVGGACATSNAALTRKPRKQK